MRIEKLEFNNFRSARTLSLEFSPNINVLAGANGAGKSTVLDAAAILLSWIIARMRHSGASGRHIKELDIANDASFANVGLNGVSDLGEVCWNLVKSRKGHGELEERTNLKQLNAYTKQIQSEMIESKPDLSIPIFVYYPVNRFVPDIPLRVRQKHSFSPLDAYDVALSGSANFRAFFEWFRNREDLENENRKYINARSKPAGYEFPDRQLEAVRAALTVFLPEFTEFSVRRNPLRMVVNKNGREYQIDQLSDGEKCLIAQVGDLARRLAMANPGAKTPLKGDGVVLIDEIDLHLHPGWQRMVIPNPDEPEP